MVNLHHSTELNIQTAMVVLVQMNHYYLVFRALLPLLLKVHESWVFETSAGRCAHACRNCLRRYHSVRTWLASGLFLSRMCDVEVFTACVIVLLDNERHRSLSKDMLEADDALLENIKNIKDALKQDQLDTTSSARLRMVGLLDHIQHCLDGTGGR